MTLQATLSLLLTILFDKWWITALLSVLFIILPSAYLYFTRNFDYWKKRGIASPPTVPIIGNFIFLTKSVPLLHCEYLQKYGKFFGLYQGQEPVLMIADPEVIKRIMVKDFHLFRNRQAMRRGKVQQLSLVQARDDQWKRIRSILTPMFTSSKLRKMSPQILDCTSSMLNTFEKMIKEQSSDESTGITVKAHDFMSNFTMDVIAKVAFATDTNAHQDPNNIFVRSGRDIIRLSIKNFLLIPLNGTALHSLMEKLKISPFYNKNANFFIELSKSLIKQRRNEIKSGQQSHDDMLQLMVNAGRYEDETDKQIYDKNDEFESHHVNVGAEELEKERNLFKSVVGTKYLSEEEIVAQALVFFIAGFETTASTLSYCLFELALNPDVQQRLYEEVIAAKKTDPELKLSTVQQLPYLDAVISETLRKYPPALAINRECTTDQYEIPEAGITLHKGNVVRFPIYALHHSEEFFPEPERFDPNRFMPENRHSIIPYSYIPFGGGPRNCIGMRLAMTELKIGLTRLLENFVIARSDRTPDKLKINFSYILLKTEPIYVQIKKRITN